MQPLSSCEIIISRLLVLKALGLDFQCRRGVVVKAVTNTTAISAQVNVRRTMKVVGNIEFQAPSPNIIIYLLVEPLVGMNDMIIKVLPLSTIKNINLHLNLLGVWR